jgi:lycopene cyclase domain-containing protein
MYLILILISLAGLAVLDIRFKLAFSKNVKAASIAIGLPYLLFVAWDLFGINQRIFFKGSSPLLVGIDVFPQFPIEEVFFLVLLNYSTLVVANFLSRSKS